MLKIRQLISLYSHWIKQTTWYKSEQWVSDNSTWYTFTQFYRGVQNKSYSEQIIPFLVCLNQSMALKKMNWSMSYVSGESDHLQSLPDKLGSPDQLGS